MIALLILGLLLLAASVTIALRGLAMPRSRASSRVAQIESYGFAADPLLSGAFGGQEGSSRNRRGELVVQIGNAVNRRFGGITEADLRRELMAAGMYTTSPGKLLGYRVIGAIGLAVGLTALAAASGSALLIVCALVIGAAAGWMLPLTVVRRRARIRSATIDRELPDLIDLLVVTIEAGLGFAASLRLASREFTGPLGDELRLTLQEQAMGLGLNEALGNLLTRADTPGMRSFVRSVVQGETLGVSIGTIMRNLATDMRKRRRQSAEERANKAPVKILFPLVFLIFPTIFIILLVPAVYELLDAFD